MRSLELKSSPLLESISQLGMASSGHKLAAGAALTKVSSELKPQFFTMISCHRRDW